MTRCFHRRTAILVLVAAALVAAACQSSPDPSADVVESQQAAERPAAQPEADEGQQSRSDNDETDQASPEVPQRSVEQAEETLDGRPPVHDPTTTTTDDESDSEQPDPAVVDDSEEISDQSARQFAAAYIELRDLKHEYRRRHRAEADPDEATRLQRQLRRKSTDIVRNHELSPEEFNAIAELLERDEQLRRQVQSKVDSLAQ